MRSPGRRTSSSSAGVSLGQALDQLQLIARDTLPAGYTVDYGGQSRQAVQESGGFFVTMGFALIIIFLSLAALFESFRDPLIILIAIKTAVDLGMHFAFDLSDADKTFRALMRHDAQQRQGGSRS